MLADLVANSQSPATSAARKTTIAAIEATVIARRVGTGCMARLYDTASGRRGGRRPHRGHGEDHREDRHDERCSAIEATATTSDTTTSSFDLSAPVRRQATARNSNASATPTVATKPAT